MNRLIDKTVVHFPVRGFVEFMESFHVKECLRMIVSFN